MSLLDPRFRTRRWLALGLTIGGAIAGALFGIVPDPDRLLFLSSNPSEIGTLTKP